MMPPAFLKEFQNVTIKWIPHNYLTRTQANTIHEEKQCCEKGSIVFHFDFAEN